MDEDDKPQTIKLETAAKVINAVIDAFKEPMDNERLKMILDLVRAQQLSKLFLAKDGEE